MTKRQNHFRNLDRHHEDGHPVDILIAKRTAGERATYTKTINALTTKIRKAAGAKGKLFVQYDTVRNDYAMAREKSYFNAGYEQGLIAGRVQALDSIRPDSSKGELGAILRQHLLDADTPARENVQVLLELAWALLHE